MTLQEFIERFGLAIVIIIIIGGAIYYYYNGEVVIIGEHSFCDNTGRFDPKMEVDGCIAIDSVEAQGDFSHYISASGISAPYGAWIGKDLLDTIFSGNDNNGVYIMLGKDASGKTCFLLKVGKTNYRTLAFPNPDAPTYFRLDAMCPALCDGLDIR